MTREEEIKARMETCGVYYVYDGSVVGTGEAEDDLHYLLARNEELQRRVERMERGLKSVIWIYREGDGPSEEVFERAYMSAKDAFDAKEQDDD
jgi:hypothetical protein